MLDSQQRQVLAVEASSTKNLLRDGVSTVRAMQYETISGDSVFALAAHGVEKLLKLTIGIQNVHRQGAWPTANEMKNRGHGLRSMDDEVRTALTNAADRPYLVDLLSAQARDRLWPLVLAALDRYASAGRFHGLDCLAGRDLDEGLNPHAMWQGLEVQAQRLVPSLVDGTAYASNDRMDRAVAELRDHVATSIERWWATVAQFLIIGVYGSLGGLVGHDCAPDGWHAIVRGYESWPS